MDTGEITDNGRTIDENTDSDGTNDLLPEWPTALDKAAKGVSS